MCDVGRERGVYNKVSGVVQSLEKFGHQSLAIFSNGGSIISYFKFMRLLLGRKERVLIIRHNPVLGFFFIVPFCILRLRGKKVILDVPTPFRSLLIETKRDGLIKRLIQIICLLMSGPWSLWPVQRVLQYAPDNAFFEFGNKEKTHLIGNGINLEVTPVRKQVPKWPELKFVLVGVARVSFWQGYDRMIRAIARFNAQSSIKVFFNIVGAGDHIEYLKNLTTDLSLESYIDFKGQLQGNLLMQEYEKAHVGVSTLGLCRKNLEFASVLKAREYCAVGIPFIATGLDPDFDPERPRFRYLVSNDESIESVVSLLEKLISSFVNIDPLEIRQYAIEHLSYDQKIKQILEGL